MNRELLLESQSLWALPLFELVYRAHGIHRRHHDPADVQRCTLISIKTGGCPEDCGYCPQSAHHTTGLKREPLLVVDEVAKAARAARENGARRFCMGAAWREVKSGLELDRVLEMVRAVKAEGLEACATLGMLSAQQAASLKGAGLDAYNHNLDTSREHYAKIVTTRTYDERLATLAAARDAGLTLCTGGILGMGESDMDRCALLAELASLEPQPESVPINILVPVSGTPLALSQPVDPLDVVRTIAVARVLVPRARLRLSAGRAALSREAQAFAFFAGANSIFLGEKLLTTANSSVAADVELLAALGCHP